MLESCLDVLVFTEALLAVLLVSHEVYFTKLGYFYVVAVLFFKDLAILIAR